VALMAADRLTAEQEGAALLSRAGTPISACPLPEETQSKSAPPDQPTSFLRHAAE
jgi:hypothetical protein